MKFLVTATSVDNPYDHGMNDDSHNGSATTLKLSTRAKESAAAMIIGLVSLTIIVASLLAVLVIYLRHRFEARRARRGSATPRELNAAWGLERETAPDTIPLRPIWRDHTSGTNPPLWDEPSLYPPGSARRDRDNIPSFRPLTHDLTDLVESEEDITTTTEPVTLRNDAATTAGHSQNDEANVCNSAEGNINSPSMYSVPNTEQLRIVSADSESAWTDCTATDVTYGEPSYTSQEPLPAHGFVGQQVRSLNQRTTTLPVSPAQRQRLQPEIQSPTENRTGYFNHSSSPASK